MQNRKNGSTTASLQEVLGKPEKQEKRNEILPRLSRIADGKPPKGTNKNKESLELREHIKDETRAVHLERLASGEIKVTRFGRRG